MAEWYVYDSGDNDPGYGPTDRTDPSQSDNWTNAYQAITTACTAAADGDIIYVASDHTEISSTATITVTGSSTVGTKTKFISVNRTTGAYETMVTGAGKISTTTSTYDINFVNSGVYIGLHFDANDDMDLANTADHHNIYENCKLVTNDFFYGVSSTHSTATILKNCALLINTTGSYALYRGNFYFEGGTLSSSVAMSNTTCFNSLATEGVALTLSGVDLSGIFANTSLIPAATKRSTIILKRCKTWTGFTIPDLTSPASGMVKCHSCDSADGKNFFTEVSFYGRIDQVTNVKLNWDYSAKMVSSANTEEWTEPLRFKLAEVYSTANPTLTVEYIHEAQGSGTGGDFQNDEFWVEIEYPDATDEALGKIDKTNRATTIRTTPADQTNSAAAWTEDLTGEIKQKSAVTISGGAAGIHTIWACLAKPSSTVYVDPDVTVS